MFGKYGQFAGGIDLPEEKHNTLDVQVTAPELPEKLYLNVPKMCFGTADIVATPGQHLSAGSLIAKSTDRNGIDLFAPTDCTIERIIHDDIVVISELGTWEAPKFEPRHMIWQAFDNKRMRREIIESSLPIARKHPEPLKKWLRRTIDFKCSHLILNAMETQPCVTSEHRTLVEFGREAIQGMVMLARAGTFRRMTIAVDSDRTASYSSLLEMLDEYNIEHVALPRKYPLGEDAMLLKVLRKREIPAGKKPCDIGVAVIDPWTCMSVYRLVVCEQRLAGRIVTIAGDRQKTFHNYYLPYGMAISDVMRNSGEPIIEGGVMNGRLCKSGDTVGYATDALLAIEPQPEQSPTQCIRCGWCSDHCPARLNVAALNDAFEMSQIARAKKLGVIACVGCGICSYICPARLPLRKRIARLAKAVKTIDTAMPLFKQPSREDENE